MLNYQIVYPYFRMVVNLLGFDMRVIRILIVGWISMQQCH